MSDITRILSQIDQGDPQATEQLLPLVYNELRKLAAAKLAHENPGQTLQATALVHEAYLRLVGPEGTRNQQPGTNEAHLATGHRPLAPSFDSRGHFFAAAAEAMRRILIDQARTKASLRRGGDMQRHDIAHIEIEAADPRVDLLSLNDALERLERHDPAKAQLVKLRYFAGLTIPQAAQALGISSTTADRHWAYARAWLHAELSRQT